MYPILAKNWDQQNLPYLLALCFLRFLNFSGSVAEDPGSGAVLTSGSGMGKKIRIRIRDEQPGSYY
jgi:hypothetical protein